MLFQSSVLLINFKRDLIEIRMISVTLGKNKRTREKNVIFLLIIYRNQKFKKFLPTDRYKVKFTWITIITEEVLKNSQFMNSGIHLECKLKGIKAFTCSKLT